MKAKKRKIGLKHILIVALTLIVVAGVAIGTVVGKYTYNVYQKTEDFSLNKLTAQISSELVDQHGKTYYTFGTAKGQYITYEQLPETLIDAVVSAEDARYFEHNGFDIPRIIKALISNITAGGITAGGSTITQQLVKKTFYPAEQQTIERKLGEIMMSIKVTNSFSKSKVMELYLNKIYFGKNDYSIGIYAASKYYFNKHPSNLTLPEAAMLAGCINSPVSYDPFVNIEKAQSRRDIVLYLMREHGYINDSMYESAKAISVAKTLKSNPIKTNRKYAAYADRVAKEVKEKTGYDPNDTVMTIYTYMDKGTQKFLNNISSGKTYRYSNVDMQVGGVVQESDTGHITGILAARKYKTGNYDYAYTERHQPGSSIKPIISYGAAFEYLYWSTGHMADDSKLKVGKWEPNNWDNKFHGDVSIDNALGNSWNLAAINTLKSVIDAVGTKKVTKYLKGFGYNMDDQTVTLSYAIGGWTYGVTTLQQAAAYAAISNGGYYIEPHCVDYIIMADTGEIINIDAQIQEAKHRAISAATAFMLRHVMTKYVKTNSMYANLRGINDTIGAKTGTSNHDGTIPGIPKGRSKDSWLCCYNADYAWAFWNGYPGKIQVKKHKYLVGGNNDAGAIASRVARYLQKKKRGKKFKKPKTVVKRRFIKGIYPYIAPNAYTSGQVLTGYFAKGHTPKTVSSRAEYNQMRLSSFSAYYSGGSIRVSFSRYAPKGRKTKKVKYHVSVYSGSKVVGSKTSSSQSFSVPVRVSKNTTFKVVGYATAKGAQSNSITKYTANYKKKKKKKPEEDKKKKKPTTDNHSSRTRTTESALSYSISSGGAAVRSGSTLKKNSITVRASGSSSKKMIVKLSGGSSTQVTISGGSSYTFAKLVPNRSYKATFIDKSSKKTLGSVSFKTKK